MTPKYSLGIDIGSTTVKIAILDQEYKVLFSDYERHLAHIQETLAELLQRAKASLGSVTLHPVITGSGGLTLSKHLQVPFVQEVVAVAASLQDFAPQTDVAIELGGEDAKIIYFTGGVDQRMNGICAGGTGSFIDQMAALLQTDASGLNEYAKNYKAIYPIAARCGVFAKSDIQPLINEGATREDLSASIFQAVVNQTISGLACGKPIRGNVAFLGGPLHFLSELRTAFIRTLHLSDGQVIAPDHSHLFAAIGAAMNSQDTEVEIDEMIRRLTAGIQMDFEVKRMEPLFADEEEYQNFRARHDRHKVNRGYLSQYHGKCYLGIDAGSTTTKLALVSEDGTLLYSFYSNNNGSPLTTTIHAMEEVKNLLPSDASIAYSCSTGYGEALLKSALMLDEGEVETVAHYYAAAFFNPNVDCILDIGGQDMKCIKIKNQTIDTILLNEACSSGCGSFIENFANSLDYTVEDFAKEALFAQNPIDLGTRCTVFMNSNVKQAQKEGAPVSDISAGLAYSVIKNALFKVIKITDPKDLGKNVVVQGGTFYNDAVLRSFEKISGCNAVRPDIAGIMGAFGAALIARERGQGKETHMLPLNEILKLSFTTSLTRCKGCTNHCLLTINRFPGGRSYVTGNRCEKGLGKERASEKVPNLFEYKFNRIFGYEPLSKEDAPRGVIGIPRVLNMYENFPFWATFFKKLGFSVVVSPKSTRKIYELGMESIPSESECYPAKISHGHIQWLLDQGISTIFYPSVFYERTEAKGAQNHYNCPIVISYPENIKNNVEGIKADGIRFIHPFMAFTDEKTAIKRLEEVCKEEFAIPASEVRKAGHAAWAELIQAKTDLQKEGERVLAWIKENKKHGIVLAGRPYHIDPEINHGIPEMIASYGIAVLTEDSISHLADPERPLIVNDQWMYHSRLYKAAQYVKGCDDLDLIQLNSFGCGLDAVTTDQVSDILTHSGKIYTVLKIDEVNNLGAARIRIRSLLSALRIRTERPTERKIITSAYHRAEFTDQMQKDGYTILCPQMSPIHFDLLQPALNQYGYHVVIPDNGDRAAIDTGLKYVNNDACFPSLIVVGQLMNAILSGEYDTDRLAIIMTQTGGGCRASNYLAFIRRALEKAGLAHIPVISLNVNGMETNSGFHYSAAMVVRAMQAIIYGDVFMRVLYRVRPYEKEPGSANALHEKWKQNCVRSLTSGGWGMKEFKRNIQNIVKEFDELPIDENLKKPRVGIVGEILVKFLPLANNHLVELLEREGAEAVMPDLMDFLSYCFYDGDFKAKYLGGKKSSAYTGLLGIRFLEYLRKPAADALKASKRFTPPAKIRQLADYAEPFVSIGNQSGEGWFLTGEMIELIHSGAKNIVCTQPFACLPNHVVGKGVIKELRRSFPDSNIIAVDYDPGASEVNQLNRIKLMLATAVKNMA
ncbi:2-hydroxyacyl-CoA dehydratase [Cuneatibacter sp. NSJ-177]|uniref:2-hydroxyacyl-CoA dehydratase n=1 Tax=Cuneatibacter sp. NSJ-177 TaxID=2931401 RepID=UPI001FD62652|nr:2-hydroxyacyl-CoA dehydratase [Cuneatibacter sp. NSJ-177]MCJ7835904.1 2-hydroxyacyl-CoA dehydratase [Cuneatibacter sp. NSJ-177]